MRRTLQAVLSRRTSIFPQSYCNSHSHYCCHLLNKRFSSIPRQSLSQKRTVSNITTPNSTNDSDSNPDLKDDGHWAELIKELIRGKSTSSYPVSYTGSIAYRTCYDACDSTRWNLFRQTFDALIMKTWEEQAKHGVDPDGARFLWKVWWFEAEESADMPSLNIKFTNIPGVRGTKPPHNVDPGLNPTHVFFLLVNKEVIASVLEGPAKGNIPFVYAVDTRYWAPNEYHEDEDDIEDEENEDYKGYLKVAVELFGEFWYCVSTGNVGMKQLGPSDHVRKMMFTERIL
ncbi:hypothetical protein BTUL_0060g00070 [Botrytis tulipae]|uniref:Uncharacterized protein n=1 Tax=Botrytis tulipae TaxID=87230 RepID=A0A4Z1ET04_9HELO|nr:hypothetical protein BTUL_0060g00070 [Botrytis tulipae]